MNDSTHQLEEGETQQCQKSSGVYLWYFDVLHGLIKAVKELGVLVIQDNMQYQHRATGRAFSHWLKLQAFQTE